MMVLGAQSGPEIRRRVLILDFVNQQKNEKVDYLSGSIADAYLEPLGKTKKFEILPRSDAHKIIKQNNMNSADTFNEEIAIKLGEAAKVDVVVIGNFVAIEPHINIQARAIDVSEKRVVVSRTRVAKIDATIFDKINILATDMASEMAEKLPPMAQRVVYKDSGLFFAKDFIFHGALNSTIAWGFENKYLQPGIGGQLSTSFKLFHRFVQPIVLARFSAATGKTQISTMNQFDFSGGFTFALNWQRKLWIVQETYFRPYVASGVASGLIKAGYEINYLVPAFSGGMIIDFYLHRNLSLALLVQQQILVETDTTLKLFSFGVGAGYRL